jgi:osmoprotectant transport system ATP-binding protein
MSITLENISKSFNSTKAVENFTYTFRKSNTTVLIGPSGCGKSTLIRLIVGLVVPEKGNIKIDNSYLTNSNLSETRKRIGYVIQEGGLFPHLTAKKNVSLMANYIGWDSEKISARIKQLAELTKFPPDGLDRYPAELSVGQKQRISLMRALMLDPEFLLLDEPLGALDPLIRYDLQEDLKKIFESLEKTVILVTHDLHEAVFFSDEIILMNVSRIVQTGKIDEFIDSPSEPFVTKFITAQRSSNNPGGKN